MKNVKISNKPRKEDRNIEDTPGGIDFAIEIDHRRIDPERSFRDSNENRVKKEFVQKGIDITKKFPDSQILIGFKGNMLIDYEPEYFNLNLN